MREQAHPTVVQGAAATVIHVDPRFSRTSALADVHVPIRAGADIAFVGGLSGSGLPQHSDVSIAATADRRDAGRP